MSQIYFDYKFDDFDPEKAFGPPGREEIYVDAQHATSNKKKLLDYLSKDKKLPATDRELYPIVYYSAYLKFKELKEFQGFRISLGNNEVFDVCRAIENHCISRFKRIISDINNSAFKRSKQFESRQERLKYLWEKAELILAVDQTETGEFLRDYHGPTKRHPIEVLERNVELMTAHVEKQSQPLYLGRDLKAAAAAESYGPLFNQTLTTDYDTPDEKYDALLDDEQGSAEGV